MSTSIQTLYAVVVTVGIAVAVSIAFVALGSIGARGKANAQKVVRVVAAPAQHPTQTDEVRELVLQ
jgi:ABC-type arginine transport system permease subunit